MHERGGNDLIITWVGVGTIVLTVIIFFIVKTSSGSGKDDWWIEKPRDPTYGGTVPLAPLYELQLGDKPIQFTTDEVKWTPWVQFTGGWGVLGAFVFISREEKFEAQYLMEDGRKVPFQDEDGNPVPEFKNGTEFRGRSPSRTVQFRGPPGTLTVYYKKGG